MLLIKVHVFNKIIEINKSKLFAKHISRDCRWRLDERKCNLVQTMNNDEYYWEYKKPLLEYVFKKIVCLTLVSVLISAMNIWTTTQGML